MAIAIFKHPHHPVESPYGEGRYNAGNNAIVKIDVGTALDQQLRTIKV